MKEERKAISELIEVSINHIETASNKLNTMKSTRFEFDSLEELDKFKADRLDLEAEVNIFCDLLKSLKEAEEFIEYIAI